MNTIEELLEKPYWVIDFLPRQVPSGSAGNFSAVERYYLNEPRQSALRRAFAEILLKTGCYYDLRVCGPEAEDRQINPAPERLAARITENREDLCVLLEAENALITLNRDDLYMTVYNPSEPLLKLLDRLAAASGLFLRQPLQAPEKQELPRA